MSRRPIHWWNTAALLAIVALVATVVLVGRALNRADKVNVADLAAVAIAAALAIAAILTWAKQRNTAANRPANVTRAAEVLADLVRRQWRDEARNQLLDDPEPIPVRWQLTANEAVMSTPRLISPAAGFTFTGRSDDIAALARDFRALARRRLVITGGPGMGKTTLAVQLLLELLRTRATEEAAAGEDEVVPVPVMLPVSGWDLTAHPRLQDWLANRLAYYYPALGAPELGADAAAALVACGDILPVLDGLDEIGEQARANVIAALNTSLQAADQLILTSRTAEFAAAVTEAGRPLTSAAVITPAQLTSEAAADYLRACLPAALSDTWQTVLAALANRELSGLSELTATPLGLWLIRTVYIGVGADPTPLTGPLGADAAALRAHLLDQLIPALIQARPPSRDSGDHFRPRRRLDPDVTRCYLITLACIFDPAVTRDITWWGITEAVRVKDDREIEVWPGEYGEVVAAQLLLARKTHEPPPLTSVSTPISTWRSARTAVLWSVLVIGFRAALVMELLFLLVVLLALVGGSMTLITIIELHMMQLMGALTLGLLVGMGLTLDDVWVASIRAVRLLARERRLPRQIMLFLDDAHRLGLLRAVGPVYQFRHAALHDHLAADTSGGAS
ncbi:hypothetical protein GCM10022419_106500 [Nonomuraea rosea]|uniref:NACHT domain-containing protein n=1 Tax=Nonomuraea rosea TaxID=638574 RepID=A0ABP6ZC53_9ACTN